MRDRNSEKPETPRGEVEILPPESEEQYLGRVIYSSGRRGVKIVKLGPLSSAFLALAIGLTLMLGFLFLGGLLAILIPFLAISGVAAYLASRLGLFNRLPR